MLVVWKRPRERRCKRSDSADGAGSGGAVDWGRLNKDHDQTNQDREKNPIRPGYRTPPILTIENRTGSRCS